MPMFFLQEGRGTSGGDLAHTLAVDQHILSITSDAAIGDFKAYELALDAFLFLFRQSLAADENHLC